MHLFKTVLNVELPNPFPRLTYAEAMRRYASDKPDLRIPLELVDVADLVRDSDFKVFAGPAANPHGRVAALRVPAGGTKLSRKQIDDYTPFVARYGAKGLAYVKVNEQGEGPRGPAVADPQIPERRSDRRHPVAHGAEDGDLIFFGADTAKVVNDSLGALRLKVGHDLWPGADRLASAVGGRLSDVRMGCRRETMGRVASSVHRAARSRMRLPCARTRARHSRRVTTWC